MSRPRKADDEKLVPVWGHVPRETYVAMRRIADEQRVPLARVIRVLLTARLRTIKTQEL